MSSSVPTTFTLHIPGVLATTGTVKMAAPFSGRITGAYAAVATAPVGGGVSADLKVGADTAAEFLIAATSTSDEATLTAVNCDFDKGDILTLNITGVGAEETEGSSIVVTISVEVEADSTAVAIEPDNRFGQL